MFLSVEAPTQPTQPVHVQRLVARAEDAAQRLATEVMNQVLGHHQHPLGPQHPHDGGYFSYELPDSDVYLDVRDLVAMDSGFLEGVASFDLLGLFPEDDEAAMQL